jgi:hypothetical protein
MAVGSSEETAPDRQIAQLRVPPHSPEGESSVLGGLLLDNQAWDAVADILTEEDFYRYEHRLYLARFFPSSTPAVLRTSSRFLSTCKARARRMRPVAWPI